jgi:proteasome lid subunit RPN8/RPN11
MKATGSVAISEELLQVILSSARRLYPREMILLLRGKKTERLVKVSELVVPPLATYGHGFASVPFHTLPLDFSIVGTVHSHPSGNLLPSIADLNHSFGLVLMLVGFPYTDVQCVAVFNRDGDRLQLHVTET